jgi:hypothetical protein
MTPEELKSLEETLDIVPIPWLRGAETEVEKGDLITVKELRAKYLRR